jgi:hypothetical protein
MQSENRCCKKCGVTKPITEFSKHEAGYRHECKECVRLRYNKWNDARRDITREQARKSYHKLKLDPQWLEKRKLSRRQGTSPILIKLKDLAYEAYGGYVCACCGETERMFLTLDHVNNDGNVHRKHHGLGASLYKWLEKNGYPKGLIQVLCMNCNIGKWRNKGVCPHQGKFNDHSERK